VLPFESELPAVPPFDPLVIVDEPPDPEVPLLSEPLDGQQPPSSTIANALILMATATEMDHGRIEIATDQRQAASLLGDSQRGRFRGGPGQGTGYCRCLKDREG
jgi:hypothetical protein